MSTRQWLNSFFVIAVVLVISSCTPRATYVKPAAEEYGAAEYGKALLTLRAARRETRDPKRSADIRFSIGECFFHQRAYLDSINAFREYLRDYPRHKAGVFAKIYLAKILALLKTDTQTEKELKKEVEKSLYASPLFLAFKEYRKKPYKSVVGNVYEIHEYVNRIEVYLNEETFFEVKH